MQAKWVPVSMLSAAMWAQSPGSLPPAAATDATQDQAAFTVKQEVRNVVIDVIATDKRGQAMHSLDKAHFQVMENGTPQEIAYFEEHTAADRGTAATAIPRPALPPNVHTNVTPVPGQGSLMVLLLDALNTAPGLQSYVRAQVMDYLKQIPAGTTMAIFMLCDRLEMIQGFTSDAAVLKAALDGKAYPNITSLNMLNTEMGASGAMRSMTALSRDALGGAGGSFGSAIPFENSVAAVRASLNRFVNGETSAGDELRVRYTLDAFNALGTYLTGIPGRKNLVWFSGSVPWNINPDFSLVTDPTGREDYSHELKKLADVLTVGRISVYPIDARALSTPPGYGADGEGASYAVRGNGDAFGRQEMNAQMELAGSHMSMEYLASATGGRAQFNTNGLGQAVTKVQAVGENYYTIAYSPKDKRYDGGYRKLDIRVNEPGVKLEYRRGYFADDPAKAGAQAVRTSTNPLRLVMQRGAPDATQISFRIENRQAAVQPAADRPTDRVGNNARTLTGPVVRYDFHWVVDLKDVQFTTDAGGLHHAELDATLDAYDAVGRVLNNVYAVLPLSFTDAQYARYTKSGLAMKQTLDIPAGLVYLRAGVLDPASGRTGATEFPLTVEAGRNGMARSQPAAATQP